MYAVRFQSKAASRFVSLDAYRDTKTRTLEETAVPENVNEIKGVSLEDPFRFQSGNAYSRRLVCDNVGSNTPSCVMIVAHSHVLPTKKRVCRRERYTSPFGSILNIGLTFIARRRVFVVVDAARQEPHKRGRANRASDGKGSRWP